MAWIPHFAVCALVPSAGFVVVFGVVLGEEIAGFLPLSFILHHGQGHGTTSSASLHQLEIMETDNTTFCLSARAPWAAPLDGALPRGVVESVFVLACCSPRALLGGPGGCCGL